MLTRLKRLPSPALVIPPIALILAVGGGSFAIAALSRHDKKVVKKISRKVANRQITKRAPKLSVNRANSANTADTAANADKLGGQPASSYAPATTLRRPLSPRTAPSTRRTATASVEPM